MSTVDLGTATTAAELVNAVRTANEDGKRLLIEKEGGPNEGGEVRYRLSAESQFSRFIRNVKAFVLGGTSGYDHDYRVQLALKSLVDKESDRLQGLPGWQNRVDDLSDRIREVNGKSISGNAAAVFVRLIENANVSTVFPRDISSSHPDTQSLDHDYEEIPANLFQGYEVHEDWIPPPRRSEPSDADVSRDYDYIPSQDLNLDEGYQILNTIDQDDIDDDFDRSPLEPRTPNRASVYEAPVSRNATAVINAFSGVPIDPDAEKVPQIGKVQLRSTRLSHATEETIKTVPVLQAKTDAEFRSSLRFPERVDHAPSLNPLTKPEGFVLASLANTVNSEHFSKLTIALNRQEYNETLTRALSREDNSESGVAGPELKGSKAADLLVASKVLDEMLNKLEVSARISQENKRIIRETERLRVERENGPNVEGQDSDDLYTPLNQFSIEPDEVFTSPTPKDPNVVSSLPTSEEPDEVFTSSPKTPSEPHEVLSSLTPEEPDEVSSTTTLTESTDVDSSEADDYALLTDVWTEKPETGEKS